MQNKPMTGTSKPDLPDTMAKVDTSPNWEQSATMLAILLEDGNFEGKEYARSEIIRMGQILDRLKVERDNA